MENLNLTLQQQKEITRKNLQRVLNELPLLAEQMPEIKRDFDMSRFGVYEKLKKENLNQCKTIGCLLGNAARFFVDEFNEDFFIDNKFQYALFGKKYFPYLFGGCDNQESNYLFNHFWAKTKFNDLNSALQRIENLLKNDLECKDFDFRTNKIIN